MVTINTILAEALDFIATEIEGHLSDGTEFNTAVQKVLEDIITMHGSVVFNGDGYSEEWQVEAAARGLPNLRTTLDALPVLIEEESLELFSRYGVFNHREQHSRYEIALEHYALSIGVEAKTTLEMGSTIVLPAAIRYQTELATNAGALKAVGIDADLAALDRFTALVTALREGLAELGSALAHSAPGAVAEAEHARDELLPAMSAVRSAADAPRGNRRRRPLAASDLPGDALHPVDRSSAKPEEWPPQSGGWTAAIPRRFVVPAERTTGYAGSMSADAAAPHDPHHRRDRWAGTRAGRAAWPPPATG